MAKDFSFFGPQGPFSSTKGQSNEHLTILLGGITCAYLGAALGLSASVFFIIGITVSAVGLVGHNKEVKDFFNKNI